jgi:hypothetical protein
VSITGGALTIDGIKRVQVHHPSSATAPLTRLARSAAVALGLIDLEAASAVAAQAFRGFVGHGAVSQVGLENTGADSSPFLR